MQIKLASKFRECYASIRYFWQVSARLLCLTLATACGICLVFPAQAATYPSEPISFAELGFDRRGELMNPTDGTRPVKILVVYIQFDGWDYTDKGLNYIHNWTFATPPDRISLASFLDTASHGEVELVPARETNGSGPPNDGIVIVTADPDEVHPTATSNEAFRRLGIDLADPFIDYAYYDNPANGGDGNGTVSPRELAILVIVGNGKNCGQDDHVEDDDRELDGVDFRNRSIALGCNGHPKAYIAWFHEFIHQAFNFNEDLYAYGIGHWGIMGGDRGASAILKLMLGWTEPTVVSTDGWYPLRHALTNQDMLLLYNPDRNPNEYFLVQNRAGDGSGSLYDAPDSGLLIERVNTLNWKSGHSSTPPVETIRPDGRRQVPACSERGLLAADADAGQNKVTLVENFFDDALEDEMSEFDVRLTRTGVGDLAEKHRVKGMRGNVLTLIDNLLFDQLAGTEVQWERRGLDSWFSTELRADVPSGTFFLPVNRVAGTPPSTPFTASIAGVSIRIGIVIGDNWFLSGELNSAGDPLYPDGMPRAFNEGALVTKPWGPACTRDAADTDAWDTADTRTPDDSFDATWADGDPAGIHLYGIGPAAESTEVYVDVPADSPGFYLQDPVVHRVVTPGALQTIPWIGINTGHLDDSFRLVVSTRDGITRDDRVEPIIAGGTGNFDPSISLVAPPDQLDLLYIGTSTSASVPARSETVPVDWPFAVDSVAGAMFIESTDWDATAPDPSIFSSTAGRRSATATLTATYPQDVLTISPHNDQDTFLVYLPSLSAELPPLFDLPAGTTPPTSVPECDLVSGLNLSGPFGAEQIHTRAMLEIEIEPRHNFAAPDDHLQLISPPFPTGYPTLSMAIDCPAGRLADASDSVVRLTLDKLGRIQERLQRYAYDLRIEYKVQLLRVPGSSIFNDPGINGQARGIPCSGGFFPICRPEDFERVSTPLLARLVKPPGCPVDGCPDYYVFAWRGGDATALDFTAPALTKIRLLDAFGSLIAEAIPKDIGDPIEFPPVPTDGISSFISPAATFVSLNDNTPTVLNRSPPRDDDAPQDPPPSPYIPDPELRERILYELPTANLPEGLYFFEALLPEGHDLGADPTPLSLAYQPNDPDGDGHPPDLDNCPDTFNPNQSDFDGDNVGDDCDDDVDGDGVVNNDDFCPDTAIPEGVPTVKLNPNHWALTDDDFEFDTVTKGKGKGPGRSYTTSDTAGCSCEQIIEMQGLGNGHTKHGCSIGAMDDWVELVN